MAIAGSNSTNSLVAIQRYSNDSAQPTISLGKSRGASVGALAAVNNNDSLGSLSFTGVQTANDWAEAARITSEVDGAPGTTSVPGRLLFMTSAVGATIPTERMRIDSNGNVGIGTSTPRTLLHVANGNNSGTLSLAAQSGGQNESRIIMGNADSGGTSGPSIIVGSNRSILFGVGNSFTASNGGTFTEYMRVDNNGNVGIGTSAPGTLLDVSASSLGQGASRTIRISSQGSPNDQFSVRLRHGIIAGGVPIGVLMGPNDGNGYLSFTMGTGDPERMRIDAAGRIGIGTTPVAVAGATHFMAIGDSDTGIASRGDGLFSIYSNGSLASIFTSTGVQFQTIGTTASSANAFLDAGDGNRLLRSTSSARYKTDIRDLPEQVISSVLNLRPVVYKSNADADDKTVDWYGLIAEEVAEVDPRLCHYTAIGEEQVPDGVQYERLSVLLLGVVKKLVAEIDELKNKVSTLENK